MPPRDPAPAWASLVEMSLHIYQPFKYASAFPPPSLPLHFPGEALWGDGDILKEKCFEGEKHHEDVWKRTNVT